MPEQENVNEKPATPKWEPLPDKVNILANVFTYGGMMTGEIFKYCLGLGPQMQGHERVENVVVSYTAGYPVTRCRNAALQEAANRGFHYLLMLDDDQVPDHHVNEPGQKPFLPSALNFALAHDGPCLVGAPYTTSPPMQEVVVMKNRERMPDLPDGLGLSIDKYTRDEAAMMTGITRVAGLPTGCLLIDTRVATLPKPWFYYEMDDEAETKLASTEDIVFTRNLDWMGVPSYCNWGAWAGHAKRYITGRPRVTPVDAIPRKVHEAWSKGHVPKLIN